jgi:Family of unknown function (DUF5988)
MTDHIGFLPDNGTIDAILEGGPDELPRAIQATQSAVAEKKLKIPHRNGYEHFELVAESTAIAPVLFRWTMRTKIAE